MTETPDVGRAVRVLRRGGLVAFPTETVYGLGADATSDAALHAALRGQGTSTRSSGDRPPRATRRSSTTGPATVPDAARTLAARCWPGPLTVVVPAAAARLPPSRPAGSTRWDCASRTIRSRSSCCAAFGGGIAAPSANRFGRVSPTTAGAVVRRSRRRRRRRARRWAVLGGGRVDDRRLHRRRTARAAGRRRDARGARAPCSGRVPEVGGTTRAPGTLAVALRPAGRRRGRDAGHDSRDRAAGAGRRGTAGRASSRSRSDLAGLQLPDGAGPACPPRRRDRVRARAVRRAAAGRRSRPRRRARGRAPAERARACRGRSARSRRARAISVPRDAGRTAERRSASSTPGSVGSRCCGRSIDLLPRHVDDLLRRHRPVPLRSEAGRRGPEVLARDRGPARRPRRQDARRRVQQRDLGRARRAAGSHSTIPVIGVVEPGVRAAAAVTETGRVGVDRHGRHDRERRLPAAAAARRECSSRARRARASSSSSRPVTSTRTRSTCSPSVSSRRSGARGDRHPGPRVHALPVARPHHRRRDGSATSCSCRAPTRPRSRRCACSATSPPARRAVAPIHDVR